MISQAFFISCDVPALTTFAANRMCGVPHKIPYILEVRTRRNYRHRSCLLIVYSLVRERSFAQNFLHIRGTDQTRFSMAAHVSVGDIGVMASANRSVYTSTCTSTCMANSRGLVDNKHNMRVGNTCGPVAGWCNVHCSVQSTKCTLRLHTSGSNNLVGLH